MKKKVLIILIPFIICVTVSLLNFIREIKLDDLQYVTGTISKYTEPITRARTVDTPMSVVINDTKYVISSGIRWASTIDELEEALEVGNTVTLKYYKSNFGTNVVVAIKGECDVVTVEECKLGLESQKEVISLVLFSYTKTKS